MHSKFTYFNLVWWDFEINACEKKGTQIFLAHPLITTTAITVMTNVVTINRIFVVAVDTTNDCGDDHGNSGGLW